jgi:hypothetical protein
MRPLKTRSSAADADGARAGTARFSLFSAAIATGILFPEIGRDAPFLAFVVDAAHVFGGWRALLAGR